MRSLAVTCELCHHEAVLPADDWPDAVLAREFRPRMVCTSCGIIGAARAAIASQLRVRHLVHVLRLAKAHSSL